MSLTAGTRVGPYEILGLLGVGGMGEVYRARDTHLGRDVAIKVLPATVAQDPDRLARFDREARTLAALNHPNIATIHGLEKGDGATALVMELVEGPTLADRIAEGPIRIDEALPIARQIAEALEAAHEQGIVHRDLKPANVKVRPDGTVKVLDFGLAKAMGPASALRASAGQADDLQGSALSQSPTITSPALMTGAGMILGTAACMSPEQARGRQVDKRTDIWAFGCVLFEMLAGSPVFSGADVTDILAAIVRAEPEWAALPPDIHPRLLELLERCLEKDPKRRWHDIADVRIGLDAIRSQPRARATEAAATTTWIVRWGLAALFGVVLAAALIVWRDFAPRQGRVLPVHLQLVLPAGVHLDIDSEHPALALSPDGSRIAYVGEADGVARLYLQELAGGEPRVIAGTEGAASPFFSPDGAAIGFWTGDTLYRVSTSSGVPVAIATTIPPSVNHGATWVDGRVLILAGSPNDGLSRANIPASGTIARGDWTPLPGAPYHWPSAVPGSRTVLFADNSAGVEPARVAAMSADEGRVRPLVDGGTNPRYSPTGHVLYARAGSLYGVRFDAGRGEVDGDEFRLVEGIVMNARGAAQFSVAVNGILAYVAGGMTSSEDELVWVDRQTGATEVILDDGRRYGDPRLSPDGGRLAFTVPQGSNLDIWVLNLLRGGLTRWTSHPGEDFSPVWRPTDQTLGFATEIGLDTEQGPALGWRASPDTPPEQLLIRPGDGDWEFPGSWSPDGRWLAFGSTEGGEGRDLYVLDFATREARPFLLTPNREFAPMFHPSGDWIAFVSDRTGREEVYVLPFPDGGEAVSLSPGGGTEPVWAPKGEALYFRQPGRLMVVTFGDGPADPNPPERVLDDPFQRQTFGGFTANYDVSRDGRRFVVVRRKNPIQPTVIDIILNWPEWLEARQTRSPTASERSGRPLPAR